MTKRITVPVILATILAGSLGNVSVATAAMPATAIGPHAVADIVEKVNSTVVYIKTAVPKPEEGAFKPEEPQSNRHHRGASDHSLPADTVNHAVGAGFIFSANGYIVTNEHVIRGATRIEVTLVDGRIFVARIVGADRDSDIALLKIEADGLPVTPLGSSGSMRVGDYVIAIGHPFDYEHTVTAGIVSALNRETEDGAHMLQTDAGINPGNSGGPLFNISGEAIGINESKFGGEENFFGIGFSIPMDEARAVLQQLVEHGFVSHASVGIVLTEQGPAPGTEGSANAVVVVEVKETGPADRHLLPKDVIHQVDGRFVDSAQKVRRYVKRHVPGDIIVFQVMRNGQIMDIAVKSGQSQ